MKFFSAIILEKIPAVCSHIITIKYIRIGGI
jgi:hypothetical protein